MILVYKRRSDPAVERRAGYARTAPVGTGPAVVRGSDRGSHSPGSGGDLLPPGQPRPGTSHRHEGDALMTATIEIDGRTLSPSAQTALRAAWAIHPSGQAIEPSDVHASCRSSMIGQGLLRVTPAGNLRLTPAGVHCARTLEDLDPSPVHMPGDKVRVEVEGTYRTTWPDGHITVRVAGEYVTVPPDRVRVIEETSR